MQLKSSAILKSIFALKGNFAEGLAPGKKVFSGVEVAAFKDNADAAVSISADFEMSWAWRGSGPEVARERGITERNNIPFILELLEKFSIPITWATVGHLFLESCTRSASGLAHDDMPRPQFNERWDGDWFLHDPCSNAKKDPLWYAPDLIQQILQMKVRHEISTHTFSHVNFSALRSTGDLIKREMESCVDAMRPFGVYPGSLVFPHNVSEYSYLPILADVGIVAVRHRDERISMSYPERTPSGIYKLYESMNLRAAKHYDYAEKAKVFIQKAMEHRAVYSLWFHPSDPFDIFDSQFRRILQYMEYERNNGRLWVATMKEIACYCEARECVNLDVQSEKHAVTLSIRSSLDRSRYGSPQLTLILPVPSKATSAWIENSQGERAPIGLRPVPGKPAEQVMVNIPAEAKTLRIAF